MKFDALRFLDGPYLDGIFTLKPGDAFTIGDHRFAELSVDDDAVSPKHARVTCSESGMLIEDLGSRHGTHVNGQRITRAELEDGDRILVGSTTLLCVTSSRDIHEYFPEGLPDNIHQSRGTISGLFSEVPLTEMLQLFGTSFSSGKLLLLGRQGGAVYLRDGRIYRAQIYRTPWLSSRKALYRILTWGEGTFQMLWPRNNRFQDELTEPTEQLLQQAAAHIEAMEALRDRSPALDTVLQPALGRTGEPSDEHRNVYRLICRGLGEVQALLDHSEESDVEVTRKIIELLEQGWVKAHSSSL